MLGAGHSVTSGFLPDQHTEQLPRAPERMLTPEVAYELRESGIDAMRTVMWSSTPIAEATPALFFVPLRATCNRLDD